MSRSGQHRRVAALRGGPSSQEHTTDVQEHTIDVYFDFTCPYSRRAGAWLRGLGEPARWRPFLLRENSRDDDGPDEWSRDDALSHVSVLALALHEAVRVAAGDTDLFRAQAMEMFEAGPVEGPALREAADAACPARLSEGQVQHGLSEAAASHEQARAQSVFGTPTLAIDARLAYLKLAELPAPARSRTVYDAVLGMLRELPEVAELKRP